MVPEDRFENSVSISSDTAIVEPYRDDDNVDDSGSAYIFSCVFGDELALDFGLAGLWDYDGTNWAFISGSDVEGIADLDLY